MISIRNVSISFAGKTVLDDISLEIADGEQMVLFGKNGSGKSVLLKTVTGLIPEYSGVIEINGIDLRDYLNKKDKDIIIGYVFQKGGLFDSMNVYDNTAFGLRRKRVDEDSIAKIVTDSLTRVGLHGNEEKLPSELSGGMQKRVGLARVVCMNPSIILYDDPTAGLDPVLSDSIADLIIDIKNTSKTTSIAATHDLKVARKIADRIALLYNGKIVYQGHASDFFDKKDEYSRQFCEGDIEGPIDIF
jgi:phospholipid/cholesterol/gamma-HCH transport system ATP-binding protein